MCTVFDRRRSTVVAAAIAFVAAMAAYLPSLPTQVRTGDTAEYQTVPYILGILHPTGFPAYTIAGWMFSHALAVGTVAWRMNAFAAICTALTAAAVVLLAAALEAGPIAALAAGLTFAFGSVVWHGAAFASAHTLSGLLIVGALAASVSFARSGNPRAFLAACGCAGLGLATQPETIWVLPALVVSALWQRRTFTPRLLTLSATLAIAPLLLYAYLPIRSAIIAGQHLDTNNVAPVFGAGSIDWGSNYPPTLDGFLDEVLGRQAGAGLAVVHSFDPAKIAGSGPFWLQHATDQYNVWFLAFAALGIVALARRDPRSLSVVVAGTIGGLFFAYAYRLDIELYRYFLVSSAVTAALAAASTRFVLPRTRPAIVTAAASIALVLLAANIWLNDRSIIAETRYGGAQATIDAVRHDIPDGAIVVAAWYDATTLDYGAAIEHALDSRIIVKAFPQEYMDEYPGWARVRRVFIYANGGTLGYLPQVPQTWLHERPSTLSYYHVYEVIPNAK